MRKGVIAGAALIAGGLAYVAAPFHAAYLIHDSLRTGDAATLVERVDFASVRTSLKASIGALQQTEREARVARGLPRPSLWSRIKAVVTPGVAETMIDRYVRPEGLPRLFELRQSWQDRGMRSAGVGVGAPTLSRLDRLAAFWERVLRAEFKSIAEVELEIRDKQRADRRYISRLALRGATWTLTSVRVVGAGFEANDGVAPSVVGAEADAGPTGRRL